VFVELMKSHKKEIQNYCGANGLSVEKVFSASRCWHKDWEVLQHYDPVLGEKGLLDETPMPVMLEIYIENGKLHFKQTEHTYRLLADEPAAVAFKREPARIPPKRKPARAAAMA